MLGQVQVDLFEMPPAFVAGDTLTPNAEKLRGDHVGDVIPRVLARTKWALDLADERSCGRSVVSIAARGDDFAGDRIEGPVLRNEVANVIVEIDCRWEAN